MAERPRIMLLDTASLYFRAFYGLPETITAPDGTTVNAVRGLLEFLTRLVRDYAPTHVAACWDDDWRPQFRVAALPSYKAQRVAEAGDGEDVPDALAPQVDIIIDILAAVGIPRVGAAGYEADDVIATLTVRAPGPVRIVTGDRDLFQLVDDAADVAVLYTASRGVRRAELVDEAWIRNRYGIPAAAYADFAILRGDPSDGLPGVPGVGERTAATLLQQFGDLTGIQSAAEDPSSVMRPGVQQKILNAGDYLRRASEVVPVVRDVPLAEVDLRLPNAAADPARLQALGQRWGVQTPLQRLTDVLARIGS